MAGKPRDFAVMLRDNPWNRRRVSANMQYKDIVDVLGGSTSTWGSYFSGQSMPKVVIVHKLCELFGVDFEEGYADFKDMHIAWRATKNKKKVADGRQTKEKENVEMKEEEPTNKALPCDDKWDIEPKEVREDKDIDYIKDYVLSLLYRKVDWETFKKVDEALKDLK